MRFEWDPRKDDSNEEKHGVRFGEAMTVFGDPFELVLADPDHSESESRFLSFGVSVRGRLVAVSYTERPSDIIRIISARKASRNERRQYEERRI